MTVKDIKDDAKLIQTAYAAGKRSVTINGVEYVIKKQSHPVTFTSGGQVHNRTEHWLSARRKDGKLVPAFNVELKPAGNLRSSKS